MNNPFRKFTTIARLRRSAKPETTVGVMGTRFWQGQLEDKETNTALKGKTRYKTYSNILANVSIVAAGTRYFLNLVAKASWTAEPADDSPKAKQIAEDVELVMNSMRTPWRRVVRRSAMYRFYGYSLQEWTAMLLPSGVVGFLDIAPRAQKTIDRWDVDEHGLVSGVLQLAPNDSREIYLERKKLIYVVDDTLDDSPEGLGLFRNVAEASRRLQVLEQLEGWGFEDDLRGMPIGRAPFALLDQMVKDKDITVEQHTQILQGLTDFTTKHTKSPQRGLLLDSATYETSDEAARPSNVKQWDMELAKAGSTGLPDIANAIARITREIAITLGVENLLLGEGESGSHALARDKSHNFALIVDDTLTELAEAYERDFLDPLFELNGWDPALKPKLKPSSTQYRDILQVTGALRDIALAGAPLPPNDPAINFIRDLTGLPKQAEDIIDAEMELRDTQNEPPDPGAAQAPSQQGDQPTEGNRGG